MSTLVALVGPGSTEAARAASSAANVGFEPVGQLPEGAAESTSRMVETWRAARRRHRIYTLVDADPLAVLVTAWRARLLGEPNELELAIGLASQAPLPDYYLVAADLPPPEVDWYLAHLRGVAPARVRAVEMSGGGVLAALGYLDFGPALPSAGELAGSARTFVPLPSLSAPPRESLVTAPA